MCLLDIKYFGASSCFAPSDATDLLARTGSSVCQSVRLLPARATPVGLGDGQVCTPDMTAVHDEIALILAAQN